MSAHEARTPPRPRAEFMQSTRRGLRDHRRDATHGGLGASRIASAHLVINAVFSEAVRNKKLAESPVLTSHPMSSTPLTSRALVDLEGGILH